MAVKSDKENAKLVHRQLDRQTEQGIPASDLGELEVYVAEGYDQLTQRTSDEFAPKTYAPKLAEKAVRSWAKWQYTEAERYFAEFQSDLEKWKRKARAKYHKDDLQTNPYETPSSKRRDEISGRTNDPHVDTSRTTP